MTVSPRAVSSGDMEKFGPHLPKNGAGEVLRRSEPAFGGRISAGGSGDHPAEHGRYHLYVAAPCPFSQRFKANLRRIADYPRLSTYFRDFYRMPAFRETTDSGRSRATTSGPTRGSTPPASSQPALCWS
jgi:glutathionyl-hydroquinone reductase